MIDRFNRFNFWYL